MSAAEYTTSTEMNMSLASLRGKFPKHPPDLHVIREFSIKKKSGKWRTYVECKCKCDKIFITSTHSGAVSCGCKRAKDNVSRRNGIYHFPREKRLKRALERSAKVVFGRYTDGDISLEEFLVMCKQNCHYCNAGPSGKQNVGVKSDGSPRLKKRIDINGKEYSAKTPYWDLGSEADFIYNGLDRIDQIKGHTKDNVVVCCKTCNYMKRDNSSQDFLDQIKRIHEWSTQKKP